MQRIYSLIACLFVSVSAVQSSPLYLFTIDFNPTPISTFTSVSYLTQTLPSGATTVFTPGESTVLNLPGLGATQYPGLGAGSVSNAYASLAFNRNNSLTWLFQGSTATNITGAGTYNFSQTSLSSALDPATTYQPTGQIIVQTLAAPPVIFRYTESWNATRLTPGASFYYDSPVIIDGLLPLVGSDIHSINLPAPGTYPYTQTSLFAVGNGSAEAYFVNSGGDYYFYTAQVNPSFDGLGTFAFTSAGSGHNTANTSTTGSVTVTALSQTPEPGSVVMGLLGCLMMVGIKRQWANRYARQRFTLKPR